LRCRIFFLSVKYLKFIYNYVNMYLVLIAEVYMKRILSALIIIMILAFSLSACAALFPDQGHDGGTDGSNDHVEHVHEFNIQDEDREYLVSEATCESGSVYYYSCECGACGEETFVLDDILEHVWENATCTEAKTCTECGTTVGSAKGHSWREATCTDAKICTVCAKVGAAALGHNWNAPDCDTAKHCDRCGHTEGNPRGHVWSPATCIHPEHCSDCGIERGEVLPHDYKSGICTYCGKTLGADDGMELPIVPLE
jgi:hypothetical protein